MIYKIYCKILVSFGLVQNLEISDLAMTKVEKVNNAVTVRKKFLNDFVIKQSYKLWPHARHFKEKKDKNC